VRDLITEFRKFIMKGNLIELAVAFILALFFTAVVTTFTNGIVLAFVAAIFGEQNFDDIVWTINDSDILIGQFLNAVINFVLVGFVLFLIIKAYDAAKARFIASGEEPEPLTRSEELLEEIRDLLRSRA
jgi:large conductance mechanosensitive channel